MRILKANSELFQREMSKALGIGFGVINYGLNAMVAKGLVKINNFSHNQNKFGYVYLLTLNEIAEKVVLINFFLKRKKDEYEAHKVEIETLKSEIDVQNSEKPFKK